MFVCQSVNSTEISHIWKFQHLHIGPEGLRFTHRNISQHFWRKSLAIEHCWLGSSTTTEFIHYLLSVWSLLTSIFKKVIGTKLIRNSHIWRSFSSQIFRLWWPCRSRFSITTPLTCVAFVSVPAVVAISMKYSNIFRQISDWVDTVDRWFDQFLAIPVEDV